MSDGVNTVFLATPRSGGHAIASMVDADLNLMEYFNIENLILPRSQDGQTILYDRITPECLKYLESGDFESAWISQSAQPRSDSVYETVDNFQYVLTDKFPTCNDFITAHEIRWNALRASNKNWCVKLMRYQHVTPQVVACLFQEAGCITIIKRKDMVAQAISMLKTEYMPTNVWHATEDDTVTELVIDNFPYERIVPIVETLIGDNLFFDELTSDYVHKTNTVYYEEADMHNSAYRKMTIELAFDVEKCYTIAKDAGYE
jgi:hypothetical protein